MKRAIEEISERYMRAATLDEMVDNKQRDACEMLRGERNKK